MKRLEKERWLALARECLIQGGKLPEWLEEVAPEFDKACSGQARHWAYDLVSRFKDEVGK